MNQSTGIQYQLSAAKTPQDVSNASLLGVGSDVVIAFLQALSARLLKSPQMKPYPDIIALGFWLRDAQVNQWLNQLRPHNANVLIKPVGCVVHYTPNNVDSMFMYSWICALLAGNNNIVRLGSGQSEAKRLLLTTVEALFAEPAFHAVAERNMLLYFDKTSPLNAELAALADARMLWGGDESVQRIREFAAKPRCRDISFADRYSATVIDPGAESESAQLEKAAALLWQDSKAHHQLACSSPRVIFWLGDDDSLRQFAALLNSQAEQQDSAPERLVGQSRANEHLITAQLLQMQGKADAPLCNKRVCLLPVHTLNDALLAQHNGDGLFYVKSINNLAALQNELPAKVQTLTYWGVEQGALLKLLADPSIQGVDRCVSIGKALTFAPDWDGYRLFTDLTRYVHLD
ncbi:acyl-CoA reductase [Alteromonas lipolytica]|uniref:Long-chain-fatty-acyl-CoA reductase n=1 Tax=Alteromonas lipolytica TaxID=1856405 RepID=A0A1E8FFS5_9ALTE|nr:acyl-CoA reductase [Alteromonas lipolytica]OFI34586.1 hypothetical protein BFC17_13385 [Alteromonas lipolytica]GGF52285.1 hypothetical protein GCM10011338_00510 [Alteromonas lipolytica]